MHATKNSITTSHGHRRFPAAAKTGASQKERPLNTAHTSNPAANSPDFEVSNCGSLFLLHPLNSTAKAWMQEHLPVDSPETQFWGEAIVIEPRYVAPIVAGIIGDGLVLR
jgi:hypothetical protein